MADKKFSPMRYTASTEEAALNGALQIVGAARDEVEYEVLEQSAKGVTVRVKPRSAEAPTEAAVEAESPVEVPETPTVSEPLESALETASIETSAPIAEDVPELLAQSDAAQDAAEIGDETGADAQTDEALDALAADFAEETPDFEAKSDEIAAPVADDAPEIPPLDPEVMARVQQKAQEILDKMGLEAQAQVDRPKEAGVAALVIEGEDVGILIGKHGATLQAFQYLLNLSLNAHLEGETARASGVRVVVDAGNYRARRSSSLEQIARGAASKVRREGRVIRLDPMPAHERRLVHLFLQTESDIVTQSEGREPMRRIVVAPGTGGGAAPARPERAAASGSGGNRSGFGSFRRGDAQSERNRGLQRPR